ncbi:MotA/TolQ/ExbB proton channel family protein [Sphingobium indicum BiD32]|uniref:MotA/TolQ/ExbB proton channel family protein n=1 Tax=Sphingobium indicum BiD32 TaxID=1301087 RepID=N1MMI4_9SPHN|nr:MotA/TolQ/ExbB proton channel family protein [Sphingobium indicum]CCW16678.1 MotA/TolQ/ExbB proton channel family protein [Sphingobium indicum BiD32]
MTFDWLASPSSPFHIFLQADRLVQAIIVLLMLASVVSWSIIIGRAWALSLERHRAVSVKRLLTSIGTQDELRNLSDEAEGRIMRILGAIEVEWRWSSENLVRDYEQVRERVVSIAEMAIQREGRSLAGRTGWLATLGTSAPFIGLFGTVWGIMGSFLAIGQSQDTSLAVVAPGIAEALLATAVGLFCAIPASIGYNRLVQALAAVDAEWRSIAGLLEVAISRHFGTRTW